MTQYLHSSVCEGSENYFCIFSKQKYRVLTRKCSYRVKTVKILPFEICAELSEYQNSGSCNRYSSQNSINKLVTTSWGILTTKLSTLGCCLTERKTQVMESIRDLLFSIVDL